MPRKTWGRLSKDPAKLQEDLDKLLASGESEDVNDVITKYPRLRDLNFRSLGFREEVNLGSTAVRKLAGVIQQRGEVLLDDLACDSCKRPKSQPPFAECVRLCDEQDGKCANCVYLGIICSHGTENQHRLGRTTLFKPKKKAISRTNQSNDVQLVGIKTAQSISQPFVPALSDAIPGSSLDKYRVLNGLILPRPTGSYQKRAESLEADLAMLDSRNMKELTNRPITDLSEAFNEFRAKETALFGKWAKRAGQDPPPSSHLVRPSGSLTSSLGHRLNQPSYTTENVENGETADNTNGCIRMVMGNACASDTLLFDTVHRRSKKSEALEGNELPPEVLQHHKNLTNDIEESFEGKVEVIYGLVAQREWLRSNDAVVLPLWGEFEGVQLLLSLENNYQNQDPRFRFRRAMLIAVHPQRLFYEGENSNMLKRQDKVMSAAVLMAGGDIGLIPDYYSGRKWKKQIPRSLFGEEVSNILTTSATILKEDEISQTLDREDKKCGWHSYFSPYPHSNRDLKNLIPQALLALDATFGQADQPWVLPTDFPLPLLEWFKGQKPILFENVTLANMEDLVYILTRFLQRVDISQMRQYSSSDPKSESLKWVLGQTLLHQEALLTKIEGGHDQNWYSSFDGRAIEVCCHNCGTPSKYPDKEPRWLVHNPGHYLPRRPRCNSRKCQVKQPFAVPVDESIPFIPTEAKNADHPITGRSSSSIHQRYVRDILVDGNSNLPSTVECWCIRCKEATVTSDGMSVFVDEKPEWTLGTPLYIETERVCRNCKSLERPSYAVRYVPKSDEILSIGRLNLRNFHETYGLLSRKAHEALMDARRASSRQPRKSRTGEK